MAHEHDDFVARFEEQGARLLAWLRLHAEGVSGGDKDAEDFLSEVFELAWRSFARFEDRGPDSFYRWLLAIARGVLSARRKYLRANGRNRVVPVRSGSDSDSPGPEPADSSSGPPRKARRHETVDRIHAMLQSLGREEREVLTLYYLEAIALSGIAERLDIPRATAFDRLHAALAGAKSVLGDPDANLSSSD